jgi:ABC-type proline/glycine betaine transport system permease subunit
MTAHIAKRVTDSQPAIILATALAAVCLNHRWPVVAAVFIALQLGIVLAALARRQPRVRQAGFRFLSRASAIAQTTTEAASPPHRPHLRLVP